RDLADKCRRHMDEVEAMGGMAKAIEDGLPKLRIEEVATITQAKIDSGAQTIVGVNKYQFSDGNGDPDIIDEEVQVRRIDNAVVRAQQISQLKRLKSTRDETKVEASLAALKNAAAGSDNLMPFAIEAARCRATVGEMSSALASEFGRHKADIKAVKGVWHQQMKGAEDLTILSERVEAFVTATGRPPRILVAKLGQDGHDRGQKVIASAFSDIGFDVTIGPLFQSPDEVYEMAIEVGVDAVGISTLAASHLSHVPALRQRLDKGDGQHIELVVGGVIPPGDIPALRKAGVAAVFLPGTKSIDAASRLLDLLARRRNIG
ncbi:MAG: methylmalonyl-CoA mutase, partial [Candidatus Puniceispirillum sp.]|nr:methylmalonyl-CoA mutase [Candidatus Puniceispirillum sp.]